MKFRPCIDIHQGEVKQIVGSTLSEGDSAGAPIENFVSSKSAAEFAGMYREDRLTGGHVIMLGEGCEISAKAALQAYPNGLQIGGGINADSAQEYLDAGASHIIVTSYVFHDGMVDMKKLQNLVDRVGRDRIVLDLSCRKRPEDPSGSFFVVTNKWTKFTDYEVSLANLKNLSLYCCEFLVHGVDVEGKKMWH